MCVVMSILSSSFNCAKLLTVRVGEVVVESVLEVTSLDGRALFCVNYFLSPLLLLLHPKM